MSKTPSNMSVAITALVLAFAPMAVTAAIVFKVAADEKAERRLISDGMNDAMRRAAPTAPVTPPVVKPAAYDFSRAWAVTGQR